MPKKPTTNSFTGGVRPDRSLLLRKGDDLLSALNLRILKKENTDLDATNIRSTLPLDNLSSGFVPLGSAEYRGVLFITSYNGDTNEIELGTYPAPRLHAPGYDKEYRPLHHYTLDNYAAQLAGGCEPLDIDVQTLPFRTKELGWSCEPVFMEIKEESDGSANLYITNRIDPWVVFNSGFILESGLRNGRFVSATDISTGQNNGINESESHPIVQLKNTGGDGQLQAGHYFFYVRYADTSFNVTSFLGESRPVPLFFDSTPNIPAGGQPFEIVGKSVTLDISGLNAFAPFIEVGYLYFTAPDSATARVVDIRFPVAGNTALDIKITGTEPTFDIDPSLMTSFKPSDSVVTKSFTQQNNVLYLGNISGPQLDNPDLRRFVCALELSEGRVNMGPVTTIKAGQTDNAYGIDPQDIHRNTGYWSGESYIFSIVPVFRGGFIGQAYPITGFDNYNGTLLNANQEGIFRFSSTEAVQPWGATQANPDAFAKSIQVNVTGDATAIFNASVWLQENLIGVYIARGERNKNVLYQGLLCQCYDGKIAMKAPDYKATGTKQNITTTAIFPLWEPATYGWWMPTSNQTTIITTKPVIPYYLHTEDFYQRLDYLAQGKMGVFSTDYYLAQEEVPTNVYTKRIATTKYFNWERERGSPPDRSYIQTPVTFPDIAIGHPETHPFQLEGPAPGFPQPGVGSGTGIIVDTELAFIGYNQTQANYQDTAGFLSKAVNVPLWETQIFGTGFTSRLDEGRNAQNDGMYWQEFNVLGDKREVNISMPMALPSYIGLEDAPNHVGTTEGGYAFADKWDRSVVNVCRVNPDTLDPSTQYDGKNTLFGIISDFQTIGDFLAGGTQDYFGGDCIVARAYLKVWNGAIEILGDEIVELLAERQSPGKNDDNTVDKGWGHWMSYVGEHRCNPNYRYEIGRNLYYPATSLTQPGKEFAWKLDSPESNFISGGYKRFLSLRQVLGLDVLSISSSNRFPTRIRPSVRHIFGAVRDGYRQFTSGEEKDFDYRAGEIQRLISFSDLLFSFQNSAINLHPTNERVTQQGSAGSVAVLGEGLKLPEYRRIITDKYGCQHPFSVVIGDAGIYCIDFNRRHMIQVTGESYVLIDLQHEFNTLLREILDSVLQGQSSVATRLPDSHSCGIGILGAYFRRYNEVHTTFQLGEEQHTLVIDERMNVCLGKRSYTPRWYGQLEEELLSTSVSIEEPDKQILYQHDGGPDHLNIYGVERDWEVRMAISPDPSVTKHWDNLIISSNNRVFSRIDYETQHQTALQDPFLDASHWYTPTYRINQWRVPVRRADMVQHTTENIFAPQSPLRGRYLLLRLAYTGREDLWLNQIVTFYNITNA